MKKVSTFAFGRPVSFQVRKALLRGIVAGLIVTAVYLTVVVVTTPNLPPITAVATAITINPLIIGGIATGVGAQVAMTGYAKSLGCSLKGRKGMVGAGSGGTAFSSFLSFFSLVPLGCCGSWLLILSFLPAFVGTSASAALISYSIPLSYAGLAVVAGFTAMTAIKLRKELKARKFSVSKSKEEIR